MDSPYEYVHGDGELIQGNAGVTNHFSWLTEAGEEKIALYEEHRTTSDMSRRLRGTNRTLDPLERLPPELSNFVISQALPPHDITFFSSLYPSRLIELTTVSKKWQSFLFSTPVLWSKLYINERQEDFLATLSVFIRLSSNSPLKLFLRGKPTLIDWTGLASIVLPGAKRVTCLHFVIGNDDDFEWVPNALSNLLDRLCRLPRLKAVNFDTTHGGRVSLYRIKTFGLPSTVNFNGLFRVELPKSCLGSVIRSKFFDVTKYNTPGTLEQVVLPSQPNLLADYLSYLDEASIISSGATLWQLESLAERLAECNCFEQVVHTTTFILHRLHVGVDLSQTEDLLDCLRMLMHLQILELEIEWGERKITRDHTLSDTTSLDLRIFDLILVGDVENLVQAQKPLGDLFSALGILYPGVEEVHLCGSSWKGFEMSYLQSLRALKSLVLVSEGSPLALPMGPITLQSVQCLEMRGAARLDNLRTPNLLKLVLQLGRDVTTLDHLGPFPRGLRSLSLTLNHNMKDFTLTCLDCPDLRDLYLASWMRRASWGCPSLSNLVSIKVGSPLQTFTDSSSNQLCISLLCYPWRLPSLRQLHFTKCVEWDVLFLMLKRRNCDKSGVQRIDTVTLPFVPFAFHEPLVRLLTGEIVELPSLISLSLEATREVMFDSSVTGCFACLKNMRPGCTGRLDTDERVGPAEILYTSDDPIRADTLYPPEDPVPEDTPHEIEDWLSQRRDLVDIWKTSYEEFAKEHFRLAQCVEWRVGSDGFSSYNL